MLSIFFLFSLFLEDSWNTVVTHLRVTQSHVKVRPINICQTSSKEIGSCGPLWYWFLALPFSFPDWETAACRGEKTWIFSNAFCSFFFPTSASSFLIKIQQQTWRTQITGVRHEAASAFPVLQCAGMHLCFLHGIAWLHPLPSSCMPPTHPASPSHLLLAGKHNRSLPVAPSSSVGRPYPILSFSHSWISRVCHQTLFKSCWFTNLCCLFVMNCCYSRARDIWLNSPFDQSF